MSEAKSELHTHTHTHTHVFYVPVVNPIPTLSVSYDLFCLFWFKNSYYHDGLLKSGACISLIWIHVPHIDVPACIYHICHLHAMLFNFSNYMFGYHIAL